MHTNEAEIAEILSVEETGKAMKESKGFTHTLARLPIFFVLWVVVLVELAAYVWLRFVVGAWELLSGRRSRRVLARATQRQEWETAAKELDDRQGKDRWRNVAASKLYDSDLILRLTQQLRRPVSSSPSPPQEADVCRVCKALRAACVRNCGGVENEELYSHTFLGTKVAIQRFADETVSALQWLSSQPDFVPDSPEGAEINALLHAAPRNFGRTALCLSGGGAMAFPHLGVVLELLQAGLMPSVISGTSCGALVAAIVGVRTDAEAIDVLSRPEELARNLVFHNESWVTSLHRFVKTGHIVDQEQWTRTLQWVTLGPTTFAEAFARTGRVLNISVSNASFSRSSHNPQLLNYLTAPNVVISSAVLSSASMPLFTGATPLLEKDARTGEIKPHTDFASTRWRDGCLSADIPQEALREMFGVRYTIVSQCNPHVTPFFFWPRGSAGCPSLHRSGWGWRGGFMSSYVEKLLKAEMFKWLALLRELDLFPSFFGADWSQLFLQRFTGDCTVNPPLSIKLYANIASDSDEHMFAWYTQLGRRMIWPKLAMIRNRLRTEQQLLQVCERFRVPTSFDPFVSPSITPKFE